ncbi:elongation factor P hydroxylase [Aestuariibacter sp. AA17]|uniref:Elongation factor P hydroxylase n=1 Tax=Fluctibacter corallii TaxID=2984329 RepID=A0ABT3A360_9ALTE|nr:elongation factor P hydroxylase [Aestuariibacter sp. AA17]MCV2883088.1 elongation factor P hydroxylase [Aestuariibacter sp. AA17]
MVADKQDSHRIQDLISIFNAAFSESENTRLVRGDDEPIYLPADERISYHRIIFAHGYYASALHEIAHWCIAGKARRLLEDYGYWYCPDGRNAQQQAEFEKVEIKPQAVEWGLSLAANKTFRVSTDNLHGAEPDRETFTKHVREQLIHYIETGFPPRAEQLIQALHLFYGTPPLGKHLPNLKQQLDAYDECI